MIKNKLFSKLNIKDYNNQLEKVLENKVYSLNTKNLLLNMFYEIENSYADYEEAKRQVPLKESEIRKYQRKRDAFNHVTVMYRKSSVLAAGILLP